MFILLHIDVVGRHEKLTLMCEYIGDRIGFYIFHITISSSKVTIIYLFLLLTCLNFPFLIIILSLDNHRSGINISINVDTNVG